MNTTNIVEEQSKKLIRLINANDTRELNKFLSTDFLELSNDNKISVILSNKYPLWKAVQKSIDCIETILNAKSLIDLAQQHKYRIFATPIQNNKTLLELALQKSSAYLKVILENKIIKSLNNHDWFIILKTTLSNQKLFFEDIASRTVDYIETALASDIFMQLNYEQQVDILTSSAQYGNLPLFVAATRKTSQNLAAFINSDTLKQLPSNYKIYLLNKTDKNGKIILHHAAVMGVEHLNVILNDGFLNNLEMEQIYELFIFKDNNEISLLRSVIISSHKNKDPEVVITYLKSGLFATLSKELKDDIMRFSTDSYLDLFVQLGRYDKSISPFFSAVEFSFADHYIETVKKYNKVDELEKLSKLVLYPGHLQAVDQRNYSVLYYLCAKGFNATLINQYQNEGAKLITPLGYNVEIINKKAFLFTVEGAKKTVLTITGSQKQGNIELGLESAFHQKGLNVVSINTNCNDQIVEQDIYKIVKNYSAIYDIELLIINIHGGDSAKELVLDIVDKNSVAVSSKHFFTNLVKALGKNNPIDILLTSCNGQLSIKTIQNLLPKGSKFVTLGENQNGQIIHTAVADMQNIAKAIESASFSNNNAHEINLESLLNDYLMHMSHGKGSPTYTVVGKSSFMIRELDSPQKCISSLHEHQKHNLINILCNLADYSCSDSAEAVLSRFEKSKGLDIGGVEYLNSIVNSDNRASELGSILAIKFNYALYCNKLWGISAVSKSELGFCCENVDKNVDISGSCTDLHWWQLTWYHL